jgi:hypothetical protein
MTTAQQVKVYDEIRCDRAILMPDRVRLRKDGCWFDLIPPNDPIRDPDYLPPGAGEKQLAQDASRGVLNERGSTHGDFKENGAIMQALKDTMRSHFGWSKLEPYEREALEMIQHKVGRILCGNHKFFDHWRDISGYAKLVEERCPKPEAK